MASEETRDAVRAGQRKLRARGVGRVRQRGRREGRGGAGTGGLDYRPGGEMFYMGAFGLDEFSHAGEPE